MPILHPLHPVLGCLSPYEFFNLLNDDRQIGMDETHLSRGHTIAFDVRWNVFVVRMRTLQLRNIWVGHRVIPPQRLAFTCKFIKIPDNAMSDKINPSTGSGYHLLKHAQHMPRAKHDMPPRDSYGLAGGIYRYGVTLNVTTFSQQKENQPGIVTVSVQSV